MQIDDIYRYPVKGPAPERLAKLNPPASAVVANPVKQPATNFGHTDCRHTDYGVYAAVVEGRMIRAGDAVNLADAIRTEA